MYLSNTINLYSVVTIFVHKKQDTETIVLKTYWEVQTQLLYQKPGSVRVLQNILAVPSIAFFWTEIFEVIPGIC